MTTGEGGKRMGAQERIAYTRDKIAGFRLLPPGWHYGEGVPATPEAANLAEELLDYATARGLTTTNAFPGIEGEVALTIYEGDHYLEFTIYGPENIEYVREERGDEVEYLQTLSLADCKQKVDRVSTEKPGEK